MYREENGERVKLLHPPSVSRKRGFLTQIRQKFRLYRHYWSTLFVIIVFAGLILTFSLLNSSSEESATTQNVSTSDVLLSLMRELRWPIEDQPLPSNQTLQIDWEKCLKAGEKHLKQKEDRERHSLPLAVDSPSYRHQKVMGTTQRARNLSRTGYQLEGTSYFVFGRNSTNLRRICLNNFTITGLEWCSNSTNWNCNPFHKYRSYDGSCNNLRHPGTFGVAFRPFRRAVKAYYADGISKPRLSKKGGQLPSARTISLNIHRPIYRSDSRFSVMLAVWGQFLDHDITATALNQKTDGGAISCCSNLTESSPECFPVILDRSDPFTRFNVTCMEFVRSAPSPQCCLGSREQLNQASAFIDGSVVYGNEEGLVKSLRTFKGGLLRMYLTYDNRTLLPVSSDMTDGCNRVEQEQKGRYCFASGDLRANENLHLTSMHLIWARQHNRIAATFEELNPHWDDEVVFQESRKLLGAQMQHITYNEFLPLLIDKQLLKKHHLQPTKGYSTRYNQTVDATIANEFAAAAFRFAHTLIPSLIKVLGNDTTSQKFVQMRQMLFDPFKLYQSGQLDGVLKGAINSSIEMSDGYFSNELKSHLFERADALPQTCGLDLVSLNIQRGRDHGLPGYVHFKEHCGLKKTRSFEDLKGLIEADVLQNIKATYSDVEDIDLYTGALGERPLQGSLLGPTLTCLILDQFVRLKVGDRFWYENPQTFTLEQLEEIRKTSLAEVICRNSDNLEYIQPRVMEGWRKENDNVACSSIPSINLTMWQQRLVDIDVRANHLTVEVIT